VLVELSGGIAGVLMTSESARVRGGLSPELEIHGETASLAADSATGRIELLRGDGTPHVETVATDPGVNRFGSYVLPALRERAAAPAGAASEHPGLDDGVHAARYVDACLQSARSGAWERVEAA
jgi:predicted dehydrogenase